MDHVGSPHLGFRMIGAGKAFVSQYSHVWPHLPFYNMVLFYACVESL